MIDAGPSKSATSSLRLSSKSPLRSQVTQNGQLPRVKDPAGTGLMRGDSPGNTVLGRTPVLPGQQHKSRTFHVDASIVLVGIRGSGKRSLGLIAATALGRRFITEDHFFQSVTGLSRQDYLKVHGSEEFHKQDVDITRRMLEENRSKCVIDCGLGSLTSSLQEFLKAYSMTNPVIYLVRSMHQIQALLNLGERSARLLEAGDPSHRKCSNFEYYNLEEPPTGAIHDSEPNDRASPTYSFKLRQAQGDFSRFVRFIAGTSKGAAPLSPFSVEVPVEERASTHVLEIPLSLFVQGIDFDNLESAGDCVEVLVDQWNHTSAKLVTKLVATARRYIKVPILYSVRLPNLPVESYTAILNHGLRLGVEYLSIDIESDAEAWTTVSRTKGNTKIIGAYQRNTGNGSGWRDPYLVTIFQKAISLRCDAVRFVLASSSSEDLERLHWFKQHLKTHNSLDIPIIAYNTGRTGRTSQVLNPTLTSVTHVSIPRSNSEFQADGALLTSRSVLEALFDCFTLDPLDFCIVGGNVTQSLSPAMHNAAYTGLGLRHSYTTRNIKTWSDIEALAKNPSFGGASIVQPWKVRIVEKVSSLGHHGKAIGAVNTLIPLRANNRGEANSLQAQAFLRNRAGPVIAWHADNTDWLGIRECISQSLSPRNVIQPRTTGLVIGAGGMARSAVYALLQMGCKNVFLYNRTFANAKAVAAHFNNWVIAQNGTSQAGGTDVVRVIESLDQSWPEGFAMPTIIISCVTHEVLDGNPGADFEMPKQWLNSPSGGVVVEQAYMTKATSLIRQMKEYRQATSLPWVIVDGIETLIEQAMGQFEIMTGRKAPRKVMTAAIRAALRENHQYVADGEGYNT